MVRTNPLTVILAVAVAVMFASNADAQCGNSACGGCDTGGNSGFYYPGAAGCQGSGHGSFHAHMDQLKEVNKRTIARNAAWPKPFQCADRQLYFAIWDPMLTSGIVANSLFSDYHFNPRNGELSHAGRSRLRSIVQNMPIGHKSVLIQDTGNPEINNARLAHMQDIIQKWYDRNQFNEVAVTSEFPTPGSGARYEVINQLYGEGTPPPVIPVATGTGSTSDVGQ